MLSLKLVSDDVKISILYKFLLHCSVTVLVCGVEAYCMEFIRAAIIWLKLTNCRVIIAMISVNWGSFEFCVVIDFCGQVMFIV